MRKDVCYNVFKYIKRIKGVGHMTIEGILGSFTICKKYEINKEAAEYMEYIEEEPFYIPPTFNDVKTDTRISTLNPKFILFSAPGATGKSSLAKYISNKYQTIYWNLAKIKLGTNSFDGSILKAIGSQQYSNFIADLNSANVILAIDAFDEAEIISGRKMLSCFLSDINEKLNECDKTSVLLFARTETAQFIATFCAENEIPLMHYEIGFFNDTSAKDFIRIRSLGKKKPTHADTTSINAYFDFISNNISKEEHESFLGYAPVLEAISAHIQTNTNRAKLINELTGKNDCVAIIMDIMGDLLQREQNEKVIPAFKTRCQEQHTDFDKWIDIYAEEEQLVRIICYIVFKDTSYSNYEIPSLPPQMVDEYQSLLDSFLPQHPFVRSLFSEKSEDSVLDFTGPAFRDYTLARILLSESNTCAQLYFEESHSNSYFPSRLFFDYYKKITDGIIHSSHVSYVYDSFRARASAMEIPYLQCMEIIGEDEKQHDINAVFGMLTSDKRDQEHEDIVTSICNDNGILQFDQLINTSIDVPNMSVIIGKIGTDTKIYNSSVIAKDIVFNTKNVSIEAYNPSCCLIVSKNNIGGEIPMIDIEHIDSLKVSAPNIASFYRLVPYKYDFEDPSKYDSTKFIHALRCILIEFRTDKKDTLAKTADRIERVTVGSSTIKRKVLDYLKSTGIIYEAKHLYKINENTMQSKGISFVGLARMDEEQLKPTFEDFCKLVG